MAISTSINLPRSHDAQFPDRCVVCGLREPNSHVRVITGSIALWWFGKLFVVKLNGQIVDLS